nr:MAG TPA: hypothetical protein [Caudoviricetes sp.]DAJ37866.1 MAG TPA: hypothetical protein [Caudoviricetes sp.]
MKKNKTKTLFIYERYEGKPCISHYLIITI